MVDPWALRILVTVAEVGSFSGAAEQLVLSQPAVSRQVAALERRFGVALFRRRARGVVPTEAGLRAVEMAQGVLARTEALESAVRAFAGMEGSHLRVAGFASVNAGFLPRAIGRFSRSYPGVTVSLVEAGPFEVLGDIRDGAVEVALVSEWQLVEDPWAARNAAGAAGLDPCGIEGVEMVPLLDEEFAVAVPGDHPLARHERIPLGELAGWRWVDGAPPDCLGPLPELSAAIGADIEIGFMCADWNGKQAVVAEGLGIMVLPTLAAGAVGAGLAVRPTEPALRTRRLYAASAESPYRTPAAEAMVEVLRESAVV